MFHIDDSWAWDFWLAEDGGTYHMFFLYAPRSLPSPDERHFRARIGHAVSSDLRQWERGPDALGPSQEPAFDDLATWTGSVVRGDDGLWRLFYTGASKAEAGLVQRIGSATSADLFTWERTGMVLSADGRWYETLDEGVWPDQAWRDPWVLRDSGGDGWHMLITARANHGPPDERGVVGHAVSDDLLRWEAAPPLTPPGQGFGQLEVAQVELIDGNHVLIFSCLTQELGGDRKGTPGGVWVAAGSSPLGPWDLSRAQRLTDESLYAGRLVYRPDGQWALMAFRNYDGDGRFVGDISDPLHFRPLLGDDSRAPVSETGLS